MKKLIPLSFLALVLSGCCAFNVSEFPSVVFSKPEGAKANVSVAVNGFEAVVTEYESVYGYSTVYVPGYYGRRHYHVGHYETVSTQTIVPQQRTTDMFLKRAREQLEDAGFVLATATTPEYTVEAHFNGPSVETSDVWCQWGLRLLTVFLLDYEADTWTATMRIRDNRSGRLLLKQEYAQRYQANAFGLIPIFGIAACTETSAAHVQSWCLAALTDRVMADATAFLANGK